MTRILDRVDRLPTLAWAAVVLLTCYALIALAAGAVVGAVLLAANA